MPIARLLCMMPNARSLVLATMLLMLAACSGAGPSAPARACRQWPLRYSTDRGLAFHCEAGPSEGRCSAFPVSVEVTWTYASRADFVHEADVPNRILVRRRESVGCGSFSTTGCAYRTLEYAYDAKGRLLRREGSSRQSLGGGSSLEVTTFTEWDRHGRPTRGHLEGDASRVPITIGYDDVARVAHWSNGERVEQDPYGNVVHETLVLDDGRLFENTYVIESLQPVCDEG